MKLAKFVTNLIQFIFVFIGITIITFTTYTVVAFQADDSSARFSFVNKDDRVWMFDNYSYWGTDISNSVTSTTLPQPKLRVALWFDWSWWRTSMSNIDKYVVNPVTAAVKPVITPISCADEIKTYYGKDLSDFTEYVNSTNSTVTQFETLMLDYYGIVVETESVKDSAGNTVAKKISHDELKRIVDNYNVSLYRLVDQDLDENGSKDIYDVADDYNYYYQLMYKLTRYNATKDKYISEENPEGYVYYKWYKKFVIETANGGRTLSTAVYALYTLNFVNILLAIMYCWLNPIGIAPSKDGSELVPGRSVFSKLHRHHRKKKDKHKHRHEDEE